MRKIAFSATALASAIFAALPALADTKTDATAFVMNVLDKFNAGDAKAFLVAHEDNALIIDEFGPHVWSGSGSAQRWLDDYVKDARARKISGGRIDYGKPITANDDGSSVYIVLPTTYRLVQDGKKMAAQGSMTFIVRKLQKDWKIASWAYSAPPPAPEK